ncbi:c-type cytochrome [endosymbiont of unidentified scaly snail isolate Monju]|uniref:c-type cytochrome n=1 Tax=endosymbiont of unidentified scaly snail isolate Monju TaxID=1248727 RepID=UPI001E31986A|nr:cytochrome c [endosymbiont of unidentified scaly snail isolate Monju]
MQKLAGAACLLLAAGAVSATGDPQAGRAKSEACLGCHGIPSYNNVYPTYHVPKLAGQHADYIVAALKAYRDGQRQHPTMSVQASSLSDQDMADIGAFWESLGK